MEHIKLIYFPAQKHIKENETAYNLAKTAPKKASNQHPTTNIFLCKVKEINRQITLDQWGRRWENINFHKQK